MQSLGLNAHTAYKQKGKSEIDLALLPNSKHSNIEVIIEAKRADNTKEMFSPTNVNCKALHECILYFLRERDENLFTPNTSLQYIIITDFYQFYIFKSSEFRRLFESKLITKLYENFTHKKGLFATNKNPKNEDFYSELAKILSSQGFLESIDRKGDIFNTALSGYHFDLRNFENLKPKDKAHIATLLSPEFLYDERTADPNALNNAFYLELLHILGLKEIEQRKITIDEAQESSLAKHICHKLEQKLPQDSLFESMMHLIIIWLNRILFLKLIESKLLEFNDNDTNLRFLTSDKIQDFATLEHVFFEVLAKNYQERHNLNQAFSYLPYLNSSLFDKDELEKDYLTIGALDSKLHITYYPKTSLKDRDNKQKQGKTPFLAYLFDFLNSYSFGLESSKVDSKADSKIGYKIDSKADSRVETQSKNLESKIQDFHKDSNMTESSTDSHSTQSPESIQSKSIQSESIQELAPESTYKTLIKSSVLGSVFERLNGYKEGSFYTPSFITNYMCKEAIEKVVLEKFNTKYGFNARDIDDLENDITKFIRKNNPNKNHTDYYEKEWELKYKLKQTLLSTTICDPSVGSGHFLVSALNVMMKLYARFGLFAIPDNPKQFKAFHDEKSDEKIPVFYLGLRDDELYTYDRNRQDIIYKRPTQRNIDSHKIQKALFNAKREIIESCLFGVDINPISCHIAQLRLWIELLKSTYYTDVESSVIDAKSPFVIAKHEVLKQSSHSSSLSYHCEGAKRVKQSSHSEPLGEESKPQESLKHTQSRQKQIKLDSTTHRLETLPNIDINIKCGNSLVSYIDTKSTIETFLENMEKREAKAQEQQDMFAIQELESLKQDTQKKFYKDYKEAKESSNQYKNAKGEQASLYKQEYENHTQRLIELFKRNCDWYIDFYQALKDFFYQYGYINLTQLEPEIRFQIESYVEYFDFHKNINFERKVKREIDSKRLQTLLKYLKAYEDAQNLATFEWRFAFPEVLDNNGDFMGFDIVIGNPPYIKEADNKKAFENTKNLRTYQGKMDIWYHFVGKGFDILKNRGILNFIATNNWTTNSGAKKLRNMILTESKILNLIDFGSYMCFENASIQTMIMAFQKLDSIPEQYSIHYARIDSKDPTHEHRELILKQTKANGLVYLTPTIKPSELMNKPITFADSTQERVLEKIRAMGKIYLKEKEVGAGICPSLDDLFVVNDINNFSDKEKQYLKEWHTGLPQKYKACSNTNFIIYMSAKNYNKDNLDDLPNIKNHFEPHKDILKKAKIKYKTPNKPYFFLHRERDERFFIEGNEKIISQIRCEKPTFVYCKENFYGSRALFFIQTNSYNMKLLVGILNSKTIAFWLRYKGKIQGNLYKIEKEPLMNIPLVEIDSTNQNLANEIIALVEQILESKAKDSSSDTSELESQIDSLVYRLYNLTDSEIQIIESN